MMFGTINAINVRQLIEEDDRYCYD